MSETTPPAAPASMSAEAASAERATLMASPTFRAAAVKASSAEWQTLTRLNAAIAAGVEAADAADEAAVADPAVVADHALGRDAQDEERDEAAEAWANAVPDTPSGYQLSRELHRAHQAGLPIDIHREAQIREGLHRAEVPNQLAKLVYFAAVTSASKGEQSPVAQQAEYVRSEQSLHGKWGSAFAANLALANAEASRIYEAMPEGIKGGASFRDWCVATGLANNRVIVEQLFARGQARAAKKS